MNRQWYIFDATVCATYVVLTATLVALVRALDPSLPFFLVLVWTCAAIGVIQTLVAEKILFGAWRKRRGHPGGIRGNLLVATALVAAVGIGGLIGVAIPVQ